MRQFTIIGKNTIDDKRLSSHKKFAVNRTLNGAKWRCAVFAFVVGATDQDKRKNNQKGFNNISPIFTYSVENNVVAMWMGDMEQAFLDKIKDQVSWPKVDILFAPHHGRASGKVSNDVLEKLEPKIIVIGEAPSKYLNYYQGYNTITQNSAGDIVFECIGDKVHVYVSQSGYRYDTSFLVKKGIQSSEHGTYLGSFTPKGAE